MELPLSGQPAQGDGKAHRFTQGVVGIGRLVGQGIEDVLVLPAIGKLLAQGPVDEPLEVVDYGPEGVLPIENSRPRIYVMFSQPMVPVAKSPDDAPCPE